MSKVLVTGGCGFIGSNFIRYLIEITQHDLVNVDLMTYAGQGNNLDHMKLFAPTYMANICDTDIINKIFAQEKPDYVVHFAAESHVDNSIKSAKEFAETNVVGTQVLLDISRRHDVERFLYISTDEVYGSLGLDEPSWTESFPLQPRSPYAASKEGAESLVRAAYITHKFPILITRSSNNYGPYQYPEKVIPRFVTNLIDGKKVPVYGKGENVRDWLHVEDNCRAIYHVLMNGKIGETYNIAGEQERNNLQVTRVILKHFGYGDEMIGWVADRPGHDLRYSINADKLKQLGFELKHKDFESELEKTIDWYVQHENWWRPLIK